MLDSAVTLPQGTTQAVGRRAAARLRLSVPARLLTIHGIHDCILLDLSRTGARIGLARPLPVGTDGFIKVGPIEVFGEVIRHEVGCGGGINAMRFDDHLAPDDVLAVRHHAETFRLREREHLLEQVRRWVTGEK